MVSLNFLIVPKNLIACLRYLIMLIEFGINFELVCKIYLYELSNRVFYCTYVTGFRKTDPNRTFGVSRITNLKYLSHYESLLLGCSHAKLPV